ncbi:arginine-tRNA protein transferase 2 [Achlya hypogyna]|uniref:Arginyl-tRNA--protein transferase 1 n=1 Tax=Achlya hypogyna TaxID=1202772 RepID=A0A1V9ZKR5_ACHHY|nr:arginine-tRNA protein transferase 2 [Achlya hypogyna]
MSRVRLYGNRPTQCGYCPAKRPSHQYVLEAVHLAIDDYQALIDRGWRRSGMHLYQPDRQQICCVPYTIRLDTKHFKPSKAHLRVQRKLDEFLEDRHTSSKKRKREPADEDGPRAKKKAAPSPLLATLQACLKTAVMAVLESHGADVVAAGAALHTKIRVLAARAAESDRGAFSSPAAHAVCAYLNKATGASHIVANVAQGIADALQLPPLTTVTAVNGFLNFHAATESVASNEAPTPQLPPTACEAVPDATPTLPRQKRKWELETIRPANTPEIYEIYKAYQAHVHDDTAVTPASFESFLVASPLPAVPGSAEGSFFQLYRLDGELVAVGVVDVLGDNWSSVYFFYKPAYASLQLGTYSALREIARCGSGYYYMGYYIGNCTKMQYKARFTPSELLCPVTQTFVVATKDVLARTDADASQCVCLAPAHGVGDSSDGVDIDGIILHFPDGPVAVADNKTSLHPVVLDHLRDFAAVVGPDLTRRLGVQMY